MPISYVEEVEEKGRRGMMMMSGGSGFRVMEISICV